MHIITFYSYKGGVGRTLALVNAGAELALQGRRVLLVDFDLEAPGLHTFNFPLRKKERMGKGIVDYVTYYLDKGHPPEIDEYLVECLGVGKSEGGLWVMPAGQADDLYGRRFNNINWQELYAQHQGYALFENLKAQWEMFVQPDYVLIDSRTGQTETLGICTRQLSDTVAAFFFPNEQNLRGLRKIVTDIRGEEQGPRQKRIAIHFVMSNVPNVDDDQLILATAMPRFREQLGYDEAPHIIHHYPSLDLLNQVIFTLEKPTTSLAGQYRRLVKKLRSSNPEDPEGAKESLKEISQDIQKARHGWQKVITSDVEARLDRIVQYHSADGEIIYSVAEIRRAQGKIEKACLLLEQAESAGRNGPDLWIDLAQCHQSLGDSEASLAAVQRVLNSSAASAYHLSHAIRLMYALNPKALAFVANSPAVASLDVDGLLWVAHELDQSLESLPAARELCDRILSSRTASEEQRRIAQSGLVLAAIGLGDFVDAIEFIKDQYSSDDARSLADRFNFAMARWGLAGAPDKNDFECVIDLAKQHQSPQSANVKQCISLSWWALGDIAKAEEYLESSRMFALEHPLPEFSCWRYLRVPLKFFLADLDEMRRLYHGDALIPSFVERAKGKQVAVKCELRTSAPGA